MPAPKVDSCVIRMDIGDNPTVEVKDRASFLKIVKSAFGQRRKTLPNALSAGLGISKQSVSEILNKSQVPLNSRAEQLTMEQFGVIADNYYTFGKE